MNSLYAFVYDIVTFANPTGNATEIANRYIATLGMQTPVLAPSVVSVPKLVPAPSGVGAPTPSRASSTESQTVLGKCCYTIKKKTGETEVCGKNAKNELDGKFYCGTDKSGHFASERKKVGAKPSSTAVRTGAAPSVGNTHSSITPSNASAVALLQRIKGIQPSDSPLKPQRVMGTNFFILRSNRILIDPNTNEAFGVLDPNNKDVLTLSAENVAFLQQNNIAVRSNSRQESVESQPIEEIVDEESADEDEV